VEEAFTSLVDERGLEELNVTETTVDEGPKLPDAGLLEGSVEERAAALVVVLIPEVMTLVVSTT